jgi:hypothetical protein
MSNSPFKVLGETAVKPIDKILNEISKKSSFHAEDERSREVPESIARNNGAEVYKAFIVDKEHDKGNEIHYITENAIIFIFNENSGKFITTENARKGQVKRYFSQQGLVCPQHIIDKAVDNQDTGANKRSKGSMIGDKPGNVEELKKLFSPNNTK